VTLVAMSDMPGGMTADVAHVSMPPDAVMRFR
jgi:hypothetical protein